jgi:hypothetical protein
MLEIGRKGKEKKEEDKPRKFPFSRISGLNPRVLRQLPHEPTPLDVQARMVHATFREDVAKETNQ